MENSPNAGRDLVRIHKVITRALDVSLASLPESSLTDDQRKGLILYLKAMTILLHAHHSGEDEIAFPFWESRMPAGPFDELSRQHQEMLVSLEQIEHWFDAGVEAWQQEIINKTIQTINTLRNHWNTHINLEEATVGPENSRQYLTSEENDHLAKQLSAHGQAHSQPGELVMPFIVYNLSGVDRTEFVKLLPPVVIQELIPNAWKAAWAPMKPFLFDV
jgi:hemerythrin-like domain-containing protein